MEEELSEFQKSKYDRNGVILVIPLKERVFEEIKNKIVFLEYKPGDSINESEIAKSLSVSRTPVREALLDLRAIGLIRIVPRSGIYVTDINMLELRDLYLVKRKLEGMVAELVASKITDTSIVKLGEIVEELEHSPEPESIAATVQFDHKFHEFLYNSTYNKPLVEVIKSIEPRCLRAWCYLLDDVNESIASIKNLRKVYEAICERNPQKAREEMESHVSDFIDKVEKFLS